VNDCHIPNGDRGFCGLRENRGGKLFHLAGTSKSGNLDWYYDSLPTNCVADWVCPGGTGVGYPKFAYSSGPEYGYKNLAVFYRACSFDCLFCQNWHYREKSGRTITAEELSEKVDSRTSCICYFGGDPTPQIPHALRVSWLARVKVKDRILRICWETNGTAAPSLLKKMIELSLESGGCIKFDLKTWNENLNLALCGITNKRTLDNFALAVAFRKERPSPPLVIASTLLVPGYVDREEVKRIAEYIASLDPDIPYALLAFYPCFMMYDLPQTSKNHALESLHAAREAGLKNVRIGNIHLLSDQY